MHAPLAWCDVKAARSRSIWRTKEKNFNPLIIGNRLFCPPNWAAFQSGQKKCQSHFWRIGNTIINSCRCACRNKFSAMEIFLFNFRIKCILIIWMCVCTCAWCLYYTLTSFWIRFSQVVIFWFTAVTSSPFSVILTKTVPWELFMKGKRKKEKWKNARTKESE